MLSMTNKRLLLAVGLILGLTSITLAVLEPPRQVSPPPQPLAGIDKEKAKLTFSSSMVDGEVEYFMTEKSISIEWAVTYSPGGPSDPHLSVQTEATRFWPTEVSGAGPGKLAVAGKDARTGNTVIEIWEFTLPSPFPAPYVDPASGETVYPQIHIPVTSRKVVFDEQTAGKSLVWALFSHHALKDHLLVQFWDSRDLYTLDIETGSLTLLLSPSPNQGVPQEPNLANDYVDRWSANHTTHGYVYFFSPKGNKGLDLLALFDRDRDGQIEEHRTLSRQEFKQLGLADGSAYVQYF